MKTVNKYTARRRDGRYKNMYLKNIELVEIKPTGKTSQFATTIEPRIIYTKNVNEAWAWIQDDWIAYNREFQNIKRLSFYALLERYFSDRIKEVIFDWFWIETTETKKCYNDR